MLQNDELHILLRKNQVCLFCFKDPALLAYVYAFGLFSSACLRIAQAFRRTAIVYIP